MIEPILNELSFQSPLSDPTQIKGVLKTFVELLKELKNLGVKKIRIEGSFSELLLTDDITLASYLNSSRDSWVRSVRDFLYGVLRHPYIDEGKEDALFKYDNAFFVPDDKEEYETMGLTVAYINKSFSVGLNAGMFEDRKDVLCKLKLVRRQPSKDSKESSVRKEGSSEKKEDDKFEEYVYVCCLSKKDQMYKTREFIDLMARQKDLVVKKSDRKESTIKLPAHHGSKECKEMGKRLLKDDYVCEILNSVDFSPSETNFIHKIIDPNVLEIRLTNTKAGYGIVISTSAENIIQNKWIAIHLEKKYGNN